MTIKLCPSCALDLNHFDGKYRCIRCHAWFEESECQEVGRLRPDLVETVPGEHEERSDRSGSARIH